MALLRDGYFPKGIFFYASGLDEHRLKLVFASKDTSSVLFLQKIKQGIQRINTSLDRYYHVSSSTALGVPCMDVKDLASCYQEVLAIWRKSLMQPGEIVTSGNSAAEKAEEPDTAEQIREKKNEIRMLVHNGQTQRALESLQELIKCYAKLANKKNDYISVSVEELIFDIQNDLEVAGYGKEEAVQNWMERHLRYGNLMDLKELLERMIRSCSQVMLEHSEESKADRAAKQIKVLVDANLGLSEMDIEWIAEQIHFSESYVRQVFKQTMKENVNEYIIRKRMERAGKLLQYGGLRIQEIARQCGYEDQRYFASSFKKFYGCTPSEFKKAVEKESLYKN